MYFYLQNICNYQNYVYLCYTINHLIPKKMNINNNGSTPIVPMKYVISLSVLLAVVIIGMLILGNR